MQTSYLALDLGNDKIKVKCFFHTLPINWNQIYGMFGSLEKEKSREE